MQKTVAALVETALMHLRPMFIDLFPSLFARSEQLSIGESAASGETIFGEGGAILTRIIERADGLLQEDLYFDGMRVRKTLTDQEDNYAWQSVTNTYTDFGRDSKITLMDDGSERVDTFSFGVRVRSVQVDPATVDLQDWSSQDVTYDLDGIPLTRLTRYDTGTERFEEFENGLRETVFQEDLVEIAEIWTTIRTTYDALNRLIGRDVAYDDGVARSDQFSAGIRQKTVIIDEADVADWAQITTLFDPFGIVTSREQTDDSGDVTLILFEDGARRERIIEDVDGSEDWRVQITAYDAAGVVDVTEFATRDVLADYAPFFAVDDLVF